MNQLTREEKEFVEESRSTAIGWKKQLADNCMEAPSSDRSLRLISIINRLSARVEDLEEWKESGTVVIKGAQCEIKVLQSNLSSLLSAVEPFQLSLKKMESKSSGVSEPDEMPISGFGRSIHDVPTMGDLRHLSTVAAGIRGGKV